MEEIDGIVGDLGVSSPSAGPAEAGGFSYVVTRSLDMRMNREAALTALRLADSL